MKKDLSFILDNVKVYTDMCLVRDEIPIFFTCIDDEERFYLALCTDMDIPQYCVIKVTTVQLNNMLQHVIAMKSVFTLQKECWIVTPIDNNVEHDKVQKKKVADLAEDELPDEGAYFELFNDELKMYARIIEKKMSEKEADSTFLDSREVLNELMEEIFNISFGGVAAVSRESYDTTYNTAEIKKKMVIQNDVLSKYNKEDGCIIAQANNSVVDQKNITNKISVKNAIKDSLLAAA
jgi:hypothetical protein